MHHFVAFVLKVAREVWKEKQSAELKSTSSEADIKMISETQDRGGGQ